MIAYMMLGAWLLTLIIIGVIVISTGLPDSCGGEDFSTVSFVWFAKLIYLIALAVTFYEMGTQFSKSIGG